MNEQIKELMDYAVRFRLDPDSNVYEAQVQPEDLELFAELIVRECAKWMSDGNIPDGFYEAGRMLEHFGVSE